MRVRELMSGDPVTVDADEPLGVCARRMAALRIRHLPVVDGDGRLLGVATDDGVYRYGGLVDGGKAWMWFDPSQDGPVARQVALGAEVVVAPDAALDAVLRRIAKTRQDFAVVVDGAKVAGVLTEHDAVRAAAEWVPRALTAGGEGSTPVAVVAADALATKALALMDRRGIRHLVVVDGDDRAIGVVSRGDLHAVALQPALPVGAAVARGPVFAVGPETSLREAARVLREHRVGCVPVLDAERRPLAIVTRRDVLDAVVSGLEAGALFADGEGPDD